MRLKHLILAVGLGGCDALESLGPAGGAARLPDDRGTAISQSAFQYSLARPVWRADNLYFQGLVGNGFGPWRYSVVAWNAESGAVWTVRDSMASQLSDLAVTPDDEWVYVGVTSGGPTLPTLHRVRTADGAMEMVRSHFSWSLAEFWGATARIVASADGDIVAYVVYPDSLFVQAVATGESRFVSTGCMGIGALSPSADEAVCVKESTADMPVTSRWPIVHLTTGSSRTMTLPRQDVLQFALAFRWDQAGIRIAFADTGGGFVGRLAVADLTLQQVRTVDTLSGDGLLSYDGVGWSGDGSTIAYWRIHCFNAGFKSCGGDTQSVLTAVDLASFSARRVAVVAAPTSDTPSWPALSHDGTRVAYRFQQTVYARNIAP